MAAQTKQPASSYYRFMEQAVNRPASYPVDRVPDPEYYRPVAAWIGRLVLPSVEQREHVMGALVEVLHAPHEHQALVGNVVWLRWTDVPSTNTRFWRVTRQVIFSRNAYRNAAKGWILPERVNGWPLVNPFESLAGALPADSMIVTLPEPVHVTAAHDGVHPAILFVPGEPVQTTGRYRALLRFERRESEGSDRWFVRHWDREAAAFTGPEELVRLPDVVPNQHGILPATATGIDRSPGNRGGWFAWGACDDSGTFVVQALGPRELLRLQPTRTLQGVDAVHAFMSARGWREDIRKGSWTSAVLARSGSSTEQAVAAWQEGDAALVIHVYGGVGGPKAEPAARSPLYWGHFAFGIAHVVREPLSGELIFDIVYHQVYVHNTDGLISGAQHWSRYAGDRQFGMLNLRPMQEILLKLDCFTNDFEFGADRRSALQQTMFELEEMTARYRIADGTGTTAITAINNCAQDSNQALYAAIKAIDRTVRSRPDFRRLRSERPDQARRLDRLLDLGRQLRRTMLPLLSARADWETGAATLGSSLADAPIRSLGMALRSWRTMLPPVAARAVANVFLRNGADAWILRSYQVGGENPDIEPKVPTV